MKINLSISRLIGIIISIILIASFFIFPMDRNGLLLINSVVIIATLINTRVSIISLWSIISNYVMLNVYFYDVTGLAYGILGVSTVDFVTMLRYMLIWNISLFVWGSVTDFVQRERHILTYDGYAPGKNFSMICCGIAVLSIIIAFPTMPFSFGNRFKALLPGNAWNHFAIIALLFVLTRVREYKFVAATYIFVIGWFLSHYERVDVLGLFIAILTVSIAKNIGKKENLIQIIKIAIICLIVFFVMSFLGEARAQSSFDISDMVKKFLKQNTASDVAYMYNIAIDYIKHNDLLLGKSFLRYFIEIIPVFDGSRLETTNILSGVYHSVPGGSFVLNEPLMNFGLWGVIIIPNIYIFLMYNLIRKVNVYRYIVYLFLLTTVFRYLWYGMGYIETGMIWIIPILYAMYKKITGKRRNVEI